jgi:hypothetical protein
MGDAKADTIPSLEALESCTGSALRALYAQVFHRPPPARSSAGFLRGNIAWATQAKRLKKDPTPSGPRL